MDQVLDFLGEKILDSEYTLQIGQKFNDILPLIVTKKFTFSGKEDVSLHQRKCVALAKLLPFSSDIQRYKMSLIFSILF